MNSNPEQLWEKVKKIHKIIFAVLSVFCAFSVVFFVTLWNKPYIPLFTAKGGVQTKPENTPLVQGVRYQGVEDAKGKDLGGNYSLENNEIYHLGELVNDVDVKSFKVIGDDLAKDSGHVFFSNEKVISSSIIDFPSLREVDDYFLADNNSVYISSQVLFDEMSWASVLVDISKLGVTLDPPTFKNLGPCNVYEQANSDDLYKDKNHVYIFRSDTHNKLESNTRNKLEVTEMDQLTLKPLNSQYDFATYLFAKDKNHVYVGCSAISLADPATTEMVTGLYWRDKNNIFYFNKMISDVDRVSFKVLGPNDFFYTPYAKDKNKVYFGNEVVASADPDTFEVVGSNTSKGLYGKDKNHVYSYDKIVEGVDSKNCTAATIDKCGAY